MKSVRVRIYGSQVVVARLYRIGQATSPASDELCWRGPQGGRIRVRVLGEYSKHKMSSADGAGVELLDYSVEAGRHRVHAAGIKTLCGNRSCRGDWNHEELPKRSTPDVL